MPTNEQAEYPLDTLMPVKDAVQQLVRSGVDITDQILRYRLVNNQVKGRKVNRDWMILNSEVTRICDEEQS